MTPTKHLPFNVKAQAINAENGKPIKGVFFELWKENNTLPEEGLTD
jgi:hypothetical protein